YLIQRQVGGFGQRGVRRAVREDLGGDQAAGVEADRALGEQPLGADGDQVRGARPGADEVDGHGLSPCTRTDHCTTGRAGRQAVKEPTGPARSTAILVSVPPRRRCHCARTDAPSMVPAFATSRPPGPSAPRQASTTPAVVTPPPMKTASGAGSP